MEQRLAELYGDLLEIKDLTDGDKQLRQLFKVEVRMIIRRRIAIQKELAAMD